MKALSIKQPWASLIAHGIKDIENRTWKTSYRGRIYIHASAKSAGKIIDLLTEDQYDYLLSQYWSSGTDKPLSAIIGEVDIVDCVINHPSIWAEKTNGCFLPNNTFYKKGTNIIYNWVLANPVLYDEPILNVKGKLSFWEFEICKRCKNSQATTDYNGHGHWVCDHCNRMLVNEFEEEYR